MIERNYKIELALWLAMPISIYNYCAAVSPLAANLNIKSICIDKINLVSLIQFLSPYPSEEDCTNYKDSGKFLTLDREITNQTENSRFYLVILILCSIATGLYIANVLNSTINEAEDEDVEPPSPRIQPQPNGVIRLTKRRVR